MTDFLFIEFVFSVAVVTAILMALLFRLPGMILDIVVGSPAIKPDLDAVSGEKGYD